jgi:hypothetical protein
VLVLRQVRRHVGKRLLLLFSSEPAELLNPQYTTESLSIPPVLAVEPGLLQSRRLTSPPSPLLKAREANSPFRFREGGRGVRSDGLSSDFAKAVAVQRLGDRMEGLDTRTSGSTSADVRSFSQGRLDLVKRLLAYLRNASGDENSRS